MSTTRTSRLALGIPGVADRNYNLVIDPNWTRLDKMAALGSLCVIEDEIPTSVKVSGGTFRTSNGTDVTYAGTTGLALPSAATTKIWLDEAGAIHTGSAYPAGPILKLASVTTDGSSVASIVDDRRYLTTTGGLPRDPVRTVTSATVTPTIGDRLIRADATAAAIVVPLPTLTSAEGGTPLEIAKVDASANTVTINNVAGGAVTLAAQYDVLAVKWDGSVWLKIVAP
jgi:hypothetical protein